MVQRCGKIFDRFFAAAENGIIVCKRCMGLGKAAVLEQEIAVGNQGVPELHDSFTGFDALFGCCP